MKTKHIVLSGLGVFVLWRFFWPSEKDHLNAQMAELCKKDGGVKVYETVKLPAEMFGASGSLREVSHTTENQENGTEYTINYISGFQWKEKVGYIKRPLKLGDFSKNSMLTRNHYSFTRRSDKKLLAEAIQYSRVGGDRWSPGMHSIDHCPEGPVDIIKQVVSKD